MAMQTQQAERAGFVRAASRTGSGAPAPSVAGGSAAREPAARRANAGPHATSLSALQAVVAQRVCADCEHVRRAMGDEAPAQRAAGNPSGLPDGLRAGLEQLSGRDLSGVTVHYGSPRPAQLNAHAYAQGSTIHLAPGQEKHLPHEGWHAVQQMAGRVRPTLDVGGTPVNDDAGLEREADVMGTRALAAGGGATQLLAAAGAPGAPAADGGAGAGGVVQRTLRVKVGGESMEFDGADTIVGAPRERLMELAGEYSRKDFRAIVAKLEDWALEFEDYPQQGDFADWLHAVQSAARALGIPYVYQGEPDEGRSSLAPERERGVLNATGMKVLDTVLVGVQQERDVAKERERGGGEAEGRSGERSSGEIEEEAEILRTLGENAAARTPQDLLLRLLAKRPQLLEPEARKEYLAALGRVLGGVVRSGEDKKAGRPLLGVLQKLFDLLSKVEPSAQANPTGNAESLEVIPELAQVLMGFAQTMSGGSDAERGFVQKLMRGSTIGGSGMVVTNQQREQESAFRRAMGENKSAKGFQVPRGVIYKPHVDAQREAVKRLSRLTSDCTVLCGIERGGLFIADTINQARVLFGMNPLPVAPVEKPENKTDEPAAAYKTFKKLAQQSKGKTIGIAESFISGRSARDAVLDNLLGVNKLKGSPKPLAEVYPDVNFKILLLRESINNPRRPSNPEGELIPELRYTIQHLQKRPNVEIYISEVPHLIGEDVGPQVDIRRPSKDPLLLFDERGLEDATATVVTGGNTRQMLIELLTGAYL